MLTKGNIYCDYQATTPIDPTVLKAMENIMHNTFGNPHSTDHAWGWEAAKIIRRSQTEIAELLNVETEEVFFTSGATESNNIAILGHALGIEHKNKLIAVSEIEHKAVLETAQALQRYYGWEIIPISVDKQGIININSLKNALEKGASIVSIMAVNNEIGTIQPVELISKMTQDAGAFFHCDSEQLIGSGTDFEPITMSADALSISGHKIYGPKGIGLLIIKNYYQNQIKPVSWGGEQQNGIRPGTMPTHQIVGISEALKIASENEYSEAETISELVNYFLECAKKYEIEFTLNGPPLEKRHVGNLNIRFHGVDNKQLLTLLQPSVAASTGSACNSGIPGPSHVLLAIGLSREQANSSLRFSFGRFSSKNQIESVVKKIKTALDELI